MKDILFLAHRIPFPPNKGDKIRSYHLVRYLAGRFNVHLAAFIDCENDWGYRDDLSGICKSVYLRPLRPGYARLKSLRGFLTGEALSLPYYMDSGMQGRVDALMSEHDISLVVCFSSVMSQYFTGRTHRQERRIADFVDMDSDKWYQYSLKKTFPMNWIYAREARRLHEFEKSVARVFDVCLFVSPREAELFASRAPELVRKTDYFNNGVNFEYFDPDVPFTNPLETGSAAIVFTGAMDYWANVDAVVWFVNEVLPVVHDSVANVRFYIVGSNPSDQVRQLAEHRGVVVTGQVADVRPYLAHADLVVAPLRIARGTQNKVLEAMAMRKSVVLTRAALEGIVAEDMFDGHVADDPAGFARACIRVLEGDDRDAWGHRARELITREYSWDRNLSRLDPYLRDL